MKNTEPAETGREGEIPAWLLEKGDGAGSAVRPSGTHFLAKTLSRFSRVFADEFYCERYAAKPMLLQGIDPRVKLLVLLALLVFSAFSSSIAVLAALGVIALLYARLSGLALGDYLRRVWAYIPLLVFVFSLPGASSLFTTGAPLFYLLPPGAPGLGRGLYFTAGGIAMAVRLALRPGVSLSFAFLLLLTTRWSRITGALASLHMPLLLVAVLNMTYRYIFVISALAGSMMEARFLRTVGRLGAADNRRFMGRSVAQMFIRSHFLSEEIYEAMVCRGFTGRPVNAQRFRLRAADVVFAVNNLIVLAVLLAGEVLF